MTDDSDKKAQWKQVATYIPIEHFHFLDDFHSKKHSEAKDARSKDPAVKLPSLSKTILELIWTGIEAQGGKVPAEYATRPVPDGSDSSSEK